MYVCACLCACVYVCKCVCMCVHGVYVHVYVCLCVCSFMCACSVRLIHLDGSQEHDACAEAEENLQRLLVKKTDLETHLQVRTLLL